MQQSKRAQYSKPKMVLTKDEKGTLCFKMADVDVSLANSVRRTILNDIPSYMLNSDSGCSIEINTSRQHNEILKHRLSCIPVHQLVITRNEMDNMIMELDVQNDTESNIYVTTEHFKIKDKTTGQYLEESKVREIFPKCDMTNSYILFARLRPKISDTIPGERVRMSCEFSIGTSVESSAYTAVSTCTYAYTVDPQKAAIARKELEAKLESEKMSKEDIIFQLRNFDMLDANRYNAENSFDFIIESVGVYSNRQILYAGIDILKRHFQKLVAKVESAETIILRSSTTMNNCFDITIEEGDYTIGPVLQYFITEKYFKDKKTVSYCGFKKFHPHNSDSTLRIAFKEQAGAEDAANVFKDACEMAVEFYKELYKLKI